MPTLLRALSDGYDALAGLVDDPDPAVRSRGVLLLDRLAGTEPDRVDALTPRVADRLAVEANGAVRAVLLSVLHARGVIAPLRAALSDSAPAPRMYAELVLAGVDGPGSPAFEAVRAMLRNESGANGRFRGAREYLGLPLEVLCTTGRAATVGLLPDLLRIIATATSYTADTDLAPVLTAFFPNGASDPPDIAQAAVAATVAGNRNYAGSTVRNHAACLKRRGLPSEPDRLLAYAGRGPDGWRALAPAPPTPADGPR